MNRPVGVWLIAIYAALNAMVGAYLLSKVAHQLIAHLGLSEFIISICEHICLVIAAACLFMLRKLALAVYLASVALNVALTGISLFRHSSDNASEVGQFYWFGLVLGWVIILAILAYVARLYRRGVLA